MRIPIDRESSVPLYKQILDTLQDQINSGGLPVGQRLPASRELAQSLGVSRPTVVNVYEELEALGLVFSSQGDGTYVAELGPVAPDVGSAAAVTVWPAWQQTAGGVLSASNSRKFDRLKSEITLPGLISFAEGNGDPSLFPFEDFRKAFQTVLRQPDPVVLEYGDPAGYAPLRATIAQYLTSQGIPTLPGQVLVTSGSLQAISLVVRELLAPGDVLLSESPTMMNFIDLCRFYRFNLVEVPVDEQGMQVDKVEALIQRYQPRLIYTIPNFQNPSGACLNTVRRRQLLGLGRRYNLPILEDDFVGDLRYKGAAQPAIKALDSQGHVIYVSTFSKMLFPALRIGFLVAQGPIYDRLLEAKRADDTSSSALMQRALDAYITVGRYQACLRRARQKFGRRREVMLAALQKHMPPGVKWNNPQGGLFIWGRLPEPYTSDDLLPVAMDAGVLFAPGALFFPDGLPQPYFRLNFSQQPPEVIENGIRRLGDAIRKLMASP